MKQVKPLDQLTASELTDRIQGTMMEITIQVAALLAELKRRRLMAEANEAWQPNSTQH